MAAKEELKADLAGRVRLNRALFVVNCCVGLATLFIAALASFLAGILSATETSTPFVRAAIAGLPAFMLVVYASFRFHDRSNWHARQKARIGTLYNALVYEGRSVEEISQAMSKADEVGASEMELIYGPEKPSAPKAKAADPRAEPDSAA